MAKPSDVLGGYVVIDIRSRAAAFFSAAVDHGLSLTHLRWEGRRLEARIPLQQLSLVRRVARSARSRVRLRGGGGLPFLWKRARQRPVLLTGGMVTILLYLVLSSFVWSVNVVGASLPEAQLIRQRVEAAGLKAGVLKSSIRVRAIEQAAMSVKGVLWAHVLLHGTQAYLHVVQGLKDQKTEVAQPRNLVARTYGLVTRVIVYRGVAQVKAGDNVTPGTVLIQGVEGPSETANEENGEPKPPPTVLAAEGAVFARTFTSVQVKVPLERAQKLPTGKGGWNVRLVFDGKPVFSLPETAKGLLRYDRKEQIWRIFNLPLEVQLTEYREMRSGKGRIPEQVAIQKATLEAAKRLKTILDPTARIMAQSDHSRVVGHTLVETLKVEAEENIAVPAAGRSRDSSVAEQSQ